MHFFGFAFSVGLCAAIVGPNPANAQAGGTPESLPLAPPETRPPPAIVPPTTPAISPGPMVSGGVRFLLRDVRVMGSTVLSDADIETIKRPHVGKQVGANELEEIRRQLTEVYIQRGYITSGAVLPDQTT